MAAFEQNVFVNCPFDSGYRQTLLAILFTIKRIGLNPRIALEDSDSGSIRVQKILKLIEESRFGVHDLSRIQAEAAGEHYRMNMPFELGVDFAAKCLEHDVEQWQRKRILILESERYRYQIALSDLSGCDIKNHKNDPLQAIKAVRDWFVVEGKRRLPSHRRIWLDFNDFNAYLSEQLIDAGFEIDDTDEIPVPEILAHVDDWLNERYEQPGQKTGKRRRKQ